MKSFVIVFLVFSQFVLVTGCNPKTDKSPGDLEYLLSYSDSNRVHVKLMYHPVEKDSTRFTYGEPMYGGQNDIITGLTGLTVAKGVKLRFNVAARMISVAYNSDRPLVIEYDINDTHAAEQGTRGELFRPIIMKDYFYCHGINLFLNPVFRDSTLKASQSVLWKKLPAFRLFQSYDPENDGTLLSYGKQEDFMYKLVTGANDMIIEKTKVNGTENYLVMRIRKSVDYNKNEITSYFKKYYEGIRSFWNDTSSQSYSLMLQPFLAVDHSISGMSLGSGFCGKYSFKTDTILNPERIYVLSHEIVHHWIGGKIHTEDNDQWFEEGFTDYITFYTLVMTGFMTPGQFENRFNNVLKSHYSSRIRYLPNDSVWISYWKMGDYNKLPYRRGAIFAFYLDNQIRLESKGTKNIHDMMLSLFDLCKSKDEGYKLKMNDFIEIASEYVGKEKIRYEIDRYIIRGVPIKFTSEMLVSPFVIKYKGDIPVISLKDENEVRKLFN